MHHRNAARVLPLPVGRADERVLAGRDGRPALGLRGGRLGEGRAEPVARRGMEGVERVWSAAPLASARTALFLGTGGECQVVPASRTSVRNARHRGRRTAEGQCGLRALPMGTSTLLTDERGRVRDRPQGFDLADAGEPSAGVHVRSWSGCRDRPWPLATGRAADGVTDGRSGSLTTPPTVRWPLTAASNATSSAHPCPCGARLSVSTGP